MLLAGARYTNFLDKDVQNTKEFQLGIK